MPEFLTLLPPDEARTLLLSHLSALEAGTVMIETSASLGRVAAEDLRAPHPLPEFARSTVDGYAVRAGDTYGAGDTQPAYLRLAGEVPMGEEPRFDLQTGECGLIHTGGMLPRSADSVVMVEHTQQAQAGEVEILRAAAPGENVIRVGEDVAEGSVILPKGRVMRPAEIGGLSALGITSLRVVNKPRIGLISTGDEIVAPPERPRLGQVRDVNSYTLAALIDKAGGEPIRYGIVADELPVMKNVAARALHECDALVITAGSSASTRDTTAEVIGSLGKPGVLVHGINTRPGKPTILGVCDGKAAVGLPGNPVSALVNGYLFIVPVIETLLGALPTPRPALTARLTVNLPSRAGREDWWPVQLSLAAPDEIRSKAGQTGGWLAEPIFGKSNLIFTLSRADGLLRIPPDSTGLSANESVEVFLF